MIEIKDLHAKVEGTEILKGLNLTINPGEIHAIMGPNGAGKSTLSAVLAGRDGYEVTSGSVIFEGQNLLEMAVEERAAAGLMLAFQYPVEIPGVKNVYLLKAALNAQRKARGEPEVEAPAFMQLVREQLKFMKMDNSFLHRAVNEGFSGGEKKRNEILQMLILQPKLAILDEIDSGLDIDALKTVSEGVNSLRAANRSILMITHYQRLLDYIVPDFIHVLADGQIIKSGDKSLALELEERGYDWLLEGTA
ncbi:MAG: Fe-S cluster assembly ATPase SufC [Marinospirillum sp.]|uniref:Fe-S cluster assembly ATPase SufC n=1 Tax=Marinospirillum sp. TaxID=2183934 RepID=UPI0019F03BA0|nr:Fe-S cluster assembly ATPase SufC [Marinospirillum sp.]MBE0507976.1 Fe-S cluster assembly ATPase SufC [Marinospirillum sp.]